MLIKARKNILIVLVMGFILWSSCVGYSSEGLIQIGILLDTSNSMDGLIDQAKTQIWKIVNELALAEWNGVRPDLEVALYEYGNDRLNSGEGYVRMVVPLTEDLDLVSEELFNLTTDGGSEYCGTVIHRAVEALEWSSNPDHLKLIFIAGNEEFNQGYIDFNESCSTAINNGIIVNTIFCGDFDEGIRVLWKQGADLSDGKYMNIDQNVQIAYIEAPQDEEIRKLGEELNETYIPYGTYGNEYKLRQEVQDSNAVIMSEEAEIQRSISKAQDFYQNEGWDLIDAVTNGVVELDEMESEEFPEEMQNMTDDEINEYVEQKLEEREQIQNRINELNLERREYLDNQMNNNSDNTLDNAIINAIHEQAQANNYTFN
jgi:hypothetical protein